MNKNICHLDHDAACRPSHRSPRPLASATPQRHGMYTRAEGAAPRRCIRKAYVFYPKQTPISNPCALSTGREPSEAKAKAREDPPQTANPSTLKHTWHVHGLVQPGTEIRVVPACCYIVDTSGAWKSAQEALSSCGQSKPGCTCDAHQRNKEIIHTARYGGCHFMISRRPRRAGAAAPQRGSKR
jgi:hypothetical protein